MKITAEMLHLKWISINYYDGGYSQVEAEHPLEWYIGYKEINEKTLLLISIIEPELLPSSKSVLVTKGKRTDGRWTLSLSLMKPEQENVFEILCADIITFSQNAESAASALALTAKRFKQWNKLLETQKKSLMDESSRKGLLGELIFLKESIENGYPVINAVLGWVGPDGADQDFVYSCGWYEIKAVGISAQSITISSIEQLNNNRPGELVVIRIDKCAPEQVGAISLSDAVYAVVSCVRHDFDALSLLDNKLTKYGFIDIPEYREQKYIYSGKQRFFVDANFPRLTVDLVPTQIISAQYSISLAGIEAWMMEE